MPSTATTTEAQVIDIETTIAAPSDSAETAARLINIGPDVVIRATADLPDDQRSAIRWLYAYARENNLGLKPLAAEVNLDSSTLWRVFQGKYGAKLDRITASIETYRKLAEARQGMKEIGYVETSIGKKVWQACEWALASNSMVFIYGNRGLGKTMAFEAFQRAHNHGQTRYFRCPASAGVQLLMKELAKACYLSPSSCFEALRERVFNSLDRNNLLIIDELHQVFVSYQKGAAIKCLEVLREIHDRTGCGMVLSGTSELSKAIMMGRNVELLEQFTDRGVLRVQLPAKVPMADVWKIARAYGLADQAEGTALDTVEDLMRARSLRKFSKLLQAANRLATNKKQPVSWQHFQKAHDALAALSIDSTGN